MLIRLLWPKCMLSLGEHTQDVPGVLAANVARSDAAQVLPRRHVPMERQGIPIHRKAHDGISFTDSGGSPPNRRTALLLCWEWLATLDLQSASPKHCSRQPPASDIDGLIHMAVQEA